MSHDRLPLNNEEVGNNDNLRIYLLNGQEVRLTESQAITLNAQPISHGGHLGLEQPAEGAIPITHEIPADDIPQSMTFNDKDRKQAREFQDKKKWHEKTAVRFGGATVGLIAAAGAVMGLTGSDTSSNNTQRPSATAPANPGETEPTNDPFAWEEEPSSPAQPQETSPAQPNTIDLEYVKTINSQDIPEEVYDYSMEFVNTASHTPREAAERLLQDWKIYWLSGDTSQSSDINQTLTSESVARGEKQLDVMFGPAEYRNQDNLLWDWMTGTREYLTLNMEYLITENGYSENAELNNEFKILSEKNLGNGSVEFLVENSWASNMNDLDASVAVRDIDMPGYTTNRFITISEYNGNYHITGIRSEAAQ